ncbi:Hypothetical predicted protein [Mytilus galloprovincialis]|uniref:Mab-21-like HhH/H2TH-like domain-containing protein n=1 Tax=Mytilus galloprovincialis TaxID=29158 RepID=A0A8B6DTG0_MYTGA|nr:Hypothetical predicted protein [Mytilus galloprovincialis]
MSGEHNLSVDIYKYLCQKIGCEDEVKVRRLTYLIDDLGIPSTKLKQITSGSKGEGLNLNGSDLDLMYIDSVFKVYESDNDIVPQSGLWNLLVMDTEDTHPCFTQLLLVNDHDLTFPTQVIKNLFQERTFSSELYRLFCIKGVSNIFTFTCTDIMKIHGPCISSTTDTIDVARCLKCDNWISQAQPWIKRPRTTWPSPDLISKITSCGVLFVPIGYKGSSNENLQWRISFSVAEKFLIFAFNHTQLLCYALLKIMIKEIVQKQEDLRNLLCSYFVKTLMFWMLEESDPSIWRPDKIITCFMACLKRLIYCVEYSTLLHYFIPDNNLFYLRFDFDEKDKMISILKNLFEKGIYCFAKSETLFDIITLRFKVTDSSLRRIVETQHKLMRLKYWFAHRPLTLLYYIVHYSSTKMSKSFFFVMLSSAHQNEPQILQDLPRSNNKHKYYKYKRDLSHLMIGTNSDAVAGWLVLASFFYVHEHYLLSLDIINHALRKCTSEKLYHWQIGLNQTQENLLYFFKRKELRTILKAIKVMCPKFHQNSPTSPQELQLNFCEKLLNLNPMIFAYFLRFLCYYHLHEQRSCKQSLLQLRQTIMQSLTTNQSYTYHDALSLICLGICYQIIGDTHSARQCFLQATEIDEHNFTSAAMRLSNCNVD